ncbi:IS5 family transposase [Azospirillum doebereinerae]|uniref:IS5 family transposase n=1 Tax=Azospirillum doebereinerae TaxID=92933 RepID=UPI0023686948|nr:IS5 family transposase [Azospirillum doebereinerae]
MASPDTRGAKETGPNPTDRGRPGTKRHVITDRNGTPLAIRLTGANRNDSMMVETMLDAVPPLKGPPGRPRRRPGKLHADKAYDHQRCRRECRERSVIPRIARRGVEDSKRLGRHRWVVERTLAWISRFRRLTRRYERRADIHQAFSTLACAIIACRRLERFC